MNLKEINDALLKYRLSVDQAIQRVEQELLDYTDDIGVYDIEIRSQLTLRYEGERGCKTAGRTINICIINIDFSIVGMGPPVKGKGRYHADFRIESTPCVQDMLDESIRSIKRVRDKALRLKKKRRKDIEEENREKLVHGVVKNESTIVKLLRDMGYSVKKEGAV